MNPAAAARRLLVTRPRAQAEDWVQRLAALGVVAEALPLIDIAPADDEASRAALQAAWRRAPSLAFVMFVSANAVAGWFGARPPDQRWPEGLKAGATGPGTATALRAAGLSEDQIVQPAADAPTLDAEALWARLVDWPWTGREVLVVRGEDGRDWLSAQWRQAGAHVDFVAAYRRRPPRWSAQEQALAHAALAHPEDFAWLFSSSEALGHLGTCRPGADWSGSVALATHPRIAAAAQACGFGEVRTVDPSPDAVAAALRALPAG